MDTKTSSTVADTTKFADDGSFAVNSGISTPAVPSFPTNHDSIRSFFEKPWLVYNGTWSVGQVQNDYLLGLAGGINIDNLLVVNPLWASKWAGFSMVRAKAVVRVVLNATPFHAGKVLLSFLPLSTAFDTIAPTYSAMHTSSMAARSMLPGVKIDCRDSGAIMEIPYITPADYFTLTPSGSSSNLPAYNRGNINLVVLAPLTTGLSAEQAVYFSIYVHFEDVELVGPIVPQVNGKRKKRAFKSVSEMEAEAIGTGPVSKGLSIVSSAASSLSAIPGLEVVAGATSWVAGIGAGIASMFGWSKPMLLNGPQLSVRARDHYLATSDGVSSAVPLALRSDNAVVIKNDLSYYDGDEMSFAFLKRQEALVNTLSWNVTSPIETVLYSIKVDPGAVFASKTVSSGGKVFTYGTGPPIWYLSKLFGFWRGSMRVRLEFAKTDFHAGRLQVTWTPRPDGNTPTTVTGMYAIREIVDLRTTDTLEFELPYLMPTAYLPVGSPMGTFTVTVLNELRAPETVGTTVPVLVYWSAGNDFELAAPGSTGTVWPPFSPQVLTDTSDVLTEGAIATSEVPAMSTREASECIGELFTSVRQLTARSNQIYQDTTSTVISSSVSVWPWFASVTHPVAGVITAPHAGGDVFSYVAPMYALMRGSMRVQMVIPTTTNVPVTGCINIRADTVSRCLGPGHGLATGGAAYVDWQAGTTAVAPTGVGVVDAGLGMAAFSVPYYCRTRVSLNVPSVSDAIPTNFGAPEISMPVSVVEAQCGVRPIVYRATGEDFQFSYFVGPPPVLLSTPAILFASEDFVLEAEPSTVPTVDRRC